METVKYCSPGVFRYTAFFYSHGNSKILLPWGVQLHCVFYSVASLRILLWSHNSAWELAMVHVAVTGRKRTLYSTVCGLIQLVISLECFIEKSLQIFCVPL